MRRQLTPQQWRTVEVLFHAACELPPAERDSILGERTGVDPGIAGVVRELLAADAEAVLLDAALETLGLSLPE